jgi:hypothetical protein
MSLPPLLSGPYVAVVHPDEMADATQPGAGRVLRVARVAFDGSRARVWLSDGSELGGIASATASQHEGCASWRISGDLPAAAKEVV